MISFDAFTDEMVKIGVSGRKLLKAYKNIGPKPFPKNNAFAKEIEKQTGGAATILTSKKAKKHAKSVASVHKIPEKDVLKNLPMQERLQHQAGMNSNDIFLSRNVNKTLLGASTKKPMTPYERQLMRSAASVHESLERSTHQVIPGVQHLSPIVLMKERNMLRTMPSVGGAGNVREGLESLRKTEHGVLERQVKALFGDKVLQYYRKTGKVPKAMQKAFARKMQNPEARQYDFNAKDGQRFGASVQGLVRNRRPDMWAKFMGRPTKADKERFKVLKEKYKKRVGVVDKGGLATKRTFSRATQKWVDQVT